MGGPRKKFKGVEPNVIGIKVALLNVLLESSVINYIINWA